MSMKERLKAPDPRTIEYSELPLWMGVVLASFVLACLISGLYGMEIYSYQTKHTSRFTWGKACEFEVPKHWQLQTDGSYFIVVRNREFGIKSLTNQDYYSSNWVDLKDSNVYDPILFADTCSAKACLKYYLNQELEKEKALVKNKFKPIK